MRKKILKILAVICGVFVLGFTVKETVCAKAEETAVSENVVIETSENSAVELEDGEDTDEKIDTTLGASLDELLGEEMTNEEKLEIILDIAEVFATKAGVNDEWTEAVENLKNAASEKKVDLMVFASCGEILLLMAYIIVKAVNKAKKAKADTTSADLTSIKTASGQQTKAVNELIKEEANVAAGVLDNTHREKHLALAIELQNVALRSLIHGIQLKQDFREEGLKALRESDEHCDNAKK